MHAIGHAAVGTAHFKLHISTLENKLKLFTDLFNHTLAVENGRIGKRT
jgi:hypothetical protein